MHHQYLKLINKSIVLQSILTLLAVFCPLVTKKLCKGF